MDSIGLADPERLSRMVSPGPRVMFVHHWGVIMAGGEFWIKNLAEQLGAQGVTIVAALRERGPLFTALVEMQIAVRTVPLDFLRARPRRAIVPSGIGLLRSALQLARLARSADARIMHAFSLESAEAALLACGIARLPLVVTVMNCGPFPKLDGWVLRRCDRVIVVSRAVEADVLGLGVSANRVAVIPSGITFEDLPQTRSGHLRRELGISDETPLIGVIATLERKKAQDTLLRAVPAILREYPHAEFVLIGADHSRTSTASGPYETELRQLVSSLGCAHKVHFLGFRASAAALLPDLDVSVLCSRKEALGHAAIESLAVGVPLVATEVEGLKEVVEDGVTGILVPPDDPRALARGVISTLSDRAAAKRLSLTGQQSVRDRFDARHLATRNREVYEALLAPRGAERLRGAESRMVDGRDSA
jgi:glycosyltransferase involved in cell wall biosynthesis